MAVQLSAVISPGVRETVVGWFSRSLQMGRKPPIYDFTGGLDGAEPNGGFLIDHDKNIYGTPFLPVVIPILGDPYVSGCGVVFKTYLPTGKETVLHTFERSRRRKSKQRSNFRFQR